MTTRRDFMKGLAAMVAAAAVPPPVIPSWFGKEEVEKQVLAMEFNTVPGQTYRVTFNMKLTGSEWTHHDYTLVAVDTRTKIIPIQKGKETYLQEIIAMKVPEVPVNQYPDPSGDFDGDSMWVNAPNCWTVAKPLVYGNQKVPVFLNPRARRVVPNARRKAQFRQYMRT